jgi:hypothetical protein
MFAKDMDPHQGGHCQAATASKRHLTFVWFSGLPLAAQNMHFRYAILLLTNGASKPMKPPFASAVQNITVSWR